jgi:hypothetical protein
MPTIAIIGGGTGGNLLAARLMESSTDGQRLNVMLVEARGRAGAHLKAVVRQAERTAPGAFLTRLRGEASWIGVGRRGGILVAMDSGRVLDVDRAVVVTGSLAAKAIEDATLPPGAYALASDAPPEALQGPIARVAEAVIQGLGGPAEEPPRASVA